MGLSTGHKVGLALAVAAFAGFSLVVSMLVPRYRPQFPGRGLGVFLVTIVLLFIGMLAAVEFFGKEGEEAKAGGESTAASTTTESTTSGATTTTQAAQATKLDASETEFKIKLSKTTAPAGTFSISVANDGKVPHDLVVKGDGVDEKTKLLNAGDSATLTVDLKPGTYDVYCSVPGHKQAGMDTKLTVS